MKHEEGTTEHYTHLKIETLTSMPRKKMSPINVNEELEVAINDNQLVRVQEVHTNIK